MAENLGQPLEPQVTLPWLVRLRWFGVAGQITALAVAHWGFSADLHWWPLLFIVALAAFSNLLLTFAVKKFPARWPLAHTIGVVLTLDTIILTALLAASGGPMNPFTVFYFVAIVLSAIVLSARWTTFIAVLSVVGFGILFLSTKEPSAHAHHHSPTNFAQHLHGMWVAFLLAALLTAYFIRRIAQAIANQREQIAALRETNSRNARLAALTTLAAGAAHELGSPLGTIAVAAHEAEINLRQHSSAEAIADDLRLILAEVDRCQAILQQMGTQASITAEATSFNIHDIVPMVKTTMGEELSERVRWDIDQQAGSIRVPGACLVQSVAALIKNALDASDTPKTVAVSAKANATNLYFSVADEGNGIPTETLARIGEPFFTTKQPGQGLGLGIFLARAFAESQGGTLTIESTIGVGTRATLRLPT